MSDLREVPFVDLARQFKDLEPELTRAFLEVGRSGRYILGDLAETFEREVAAYCGVDHCLGVADGSAALFLTMKGLGIGTGDEVITAPNSFLASASMVIAAGARPVFADVADDMNIDPERIEAAITPRTKAIIPVHLTGRPAPMDEIGAIAARHGLAVIEDAAQAVGAAYRGRRTGSLGTAAGFSLHPLKNLGVYGDGGLITTNDAALARKLRLLRNHGLRTRDECEMWGFNSRLDTLQAAFGQAKLARLDGWNARCRDIAARYREGLADYAQVPVDQPWEHAVYHNFVIRTARRDELMAAMRARGVDTRVHYPVTIHLQPAAAGLGYRRGDFPKAERFADTMVSLPIYPELTDDEVAYVVEVVQEAASALAPLGVSGC
jgi:dTDP-4-amino-4,6-dideoxygalactose transaminase